MVTEGKTEPQAHKTFRKDERILKPADFSRVRKTGRRVSTRSLTVYIAANASGRRRLGLSVSSRTGNSVARNRIKRLIREVFRLNKSSFPESSDILVTVKNAAGIPDYNDCEKELSKVFVTR